MSRLDRLPDIVAENLGDLRMSDALKDRVRDRIAQAETEEAQKPARRPLYARKSLWAGVALAAACLVLLFIYTPFSVGLPTEPTAPVDDPPPLTLKRDIDIAAQDEASGGVSVSSTFVIRTGDPQLTAQTLERNLTVSPAIDYSLTEQGEGDFLLTPAQPLAKGTVYKISLTALSDGGESTPQGGLPATGQSLSWAFQTESENTVVATLPADGSSWVATDSGIEITFSRAIADAEGYITVSPAVPGRLEYYDRTVVFVPTQALGADTLYTVTVAPGLTAATGEVLANGHTFAFRTGWSNSSLPSLYLSGSITESFLPDDPVVVSIYSFSPQGFEPEDVPMAATIYPLTAETYSALAREHADALHPSLGRSRDHVFDTAGLTAATTFETTLASGDGAYHLVLPETPAEGFYLIDLRPTQAGKLATDAVQKLVCVSSVSVWAQSLEGQTLLWVNDAATGQPAHGATVTASPTDGGSPVSAVAGSDGIAVLDTGGAKQAGITIDMAGQSWYDLISLSPAVPLTADRLYRATLYFDRAAYLPSDTVHYWGFITAADGSTALPQDLTLVWEGLSTQAITPDAHGVFSGEISFENLLSTYLNIRLNSGQDTIAWGGLQIMEYVKPAYVLAVSAERPYYRGDEEAAFTVAATFFDGTPAPGLALRYDWDALAETDEQGHTRYAKAADIPEQYTGWQPQYVSLNVETYGQEQGYAYVSAHTRRFFTGYMQQLEVIEAEGGWQLRADTRQIDFAKVDAWMADTPNDLYSQAFADAVAGEAYDQSFRVDVIRTEQVRRVTGTYYDFINKRTAERYTYDAVTATVDSFTLQSLDGQGLSGLLAYESTPRVSYRLEITYTTPDGAPIVRSLGLGNDYWYYRATDYQNYSLISEEGGFAEGEARTFELYNNGVPAETGGMMLYTVVQDSFTSWAQTDQGRADILCDAGLIPGFRVIAAYFDGKHIFRVDSAYCHFDTTQRALEITVTTDKASYAPGDTVTASVDIRYPDGSPAEADFVLGAVDEAAFAVADQYIYILSDLYRVHWGYPVTHASYIQHLADGGQFAEEGGEGDAGGVRSDFSDTAAFATGRTGADGTASLSFTLADSLTAWRLTCVAVTQDVRAGSATASIPATLPFFVNTVYSEKYVRGDDVVLSARGAGRAVSPSDRVAYSATIQGAGMAETLTAQQQAGQYAYFNFGKLAAGQYEIELTALFGEHRDAVRYTVQVVESRLEVPVATVTDLAGLAGLDSRRFPVTLTFFDSELLPWANGLGALLGLYGDRADQRLALAAAVAVAAPLTPDAGLESPDLSGVQQSDGGISLLGYSDSDAALTAAALVACPELIDAQAAQGYLYTVLYNRSAQPEAVASAFMGLAARGEPVLLDIRSLIDTRDDLAWGLPMARGLALLGDRTTALAWYEANVAPQLKAYGQDALYLETPTTGDGTYSRGALTAQAAALAAQLDHPDAPALLSYLYASGLTGDSPLAVLAALKAMPAPSAQGDTTLRYTLDGQSVTANLTAAQPMHTVVMGQAQLEAAGFEATSSQAMVLVRWTGGADALTTPIATGRASLYKTYEELPGNRVAVRITVHVNTALDPATDPLYTGTYTLTDVLPTGLRFLNCPYQYDSGWHLSHEDGGRVGITLDTRRYQSGEMTQRDRFDIVYYARKSLPGDYVTDSAVLIHPASGGALATGRGTLTLTP